jgi:TfoX/Sxy family transcriptional regulator of competence genes
MPAKSTSKARDDADIDPRFAPIAAAFAADPSVSRGWMMSSYGLKVNGKIFAMFGKGRLVLKLPKARVDALVISGRGERFDPGHGRLMKEWIALDTEAKDGLELAEEACRFVRSASEVSARRQRQEQ